jgi:hypothetical protein
MEKAGKSGEKRRSEEGQRVEIAKYIENIDHK